MSKKIDQNILICPNCRSPRLKEMAHSFLCKKCRKSYRKTKDKYFFVGYRRGKNEDVLERIKNYFKKYWRLYQFLIEIISPVCPTTDLKRFLRKNVHGKKIIALNLGSGNSNISKNVSNIDFFPYENVDLTCDINNLPFRDDSIDIIFNIAVLEHLPNPEIAVSEMLRVLKRGGLVYTFFPFMQGFHASPNDYSRLSDEGLKNLFNNFQQVSLKCSGGPTSSLLWMLQEWVAILFSFGAAPLYLIISLIMMMVTFPLKFIDLILRDNPFSRHISSSFVYIGRKR